jgi:hypothetical protein
MTGKLEPWLASRESYFESSDVGTSVSAAEQRLSSLEAYQVRLHTE